MRCRSSAFPIAAAIAIAFCIPAAAQEPTVTPLDLHDLPDTQMESSKISPHLIGFPSPSELLLVLAKEGSPQWRKLYHPIPKNHPADRTKAALRLGLNLTEGHLAAMARDSQKIRDVTTDLERQARTLGISSGIANSTRRINSLAEAKAWPSVAYEFESLIDHTTQLLIEQRDHQLGKLLTIGSMVRLLHISTSVVNQKDFTDPTHAISNHSTLVQLSALSAPTGETAENQTLAFVNDQIAKLERTWHPDKLLHGHKFDDKLIEESNQRLGVAIEVFAN